MVGIYKIESNTGKVYIGQSIDIDRRFYVYKKGWCKSQIKLFRSLIKYGAESHTYVVLHELPKDVPCSVLDEYEKLYIDLYKSCNIGLLNIKEGGSNGKHSLESRIKLSKSLKITFSCKVKRLEISNRMKGNKHSVGRVHTQEWKENVSKKLIGKKKPKEAIQKLIGNKYALGYIMPNERKKVISMLNKGNSYAKGITHTAEQKLAKSELMKTSEWRLPSKKVFCLNNGIIYESHREAAKALGISYKHIPCVCKGKRHHVGGFEFKDA